MGGELSKRYNVQDKAEGCGGHGYLWRCYAAKRKKDGLECSVLVFDKGGTEKKLKKKNQQSLYKRVVELMRREVCILAEFAGVDSAQLAKAQAPGLQVAQSLREQMLQAASDKVGATSVTIATATRRGPPGILQLIETFETRSEMVCVVERVVGTLGNVAYNEGEYKTINSRDWTPPARLGPVEICRGAASLTEALTALHSGAGLFQRRVHFAIGPENIWISGASGDWRLAGLGMSRVFEDANQLKLRVGELFGNEMDGAFGEVLSGAPRLRYCAPELTQGVDVDTRIDVFSVYLIVLELLNDNRQVFAECSDSVYQHKTGAVRAIQTAVGSMSRSAASASIADILERALRPDPLARPEAAALRTAPGLQAPGVRLLAELDACGARETAVASNFLAALAGLIERADKLYPDGDDSENLLSGDTDGVSALASSRALRVAIIPTLLRLAKTKGQHLAPQVAASLLSCALRLDSQDFRSRLQPVFEAVLAANNDAALKLVVDAAPVVLEKADATWAAEVMIKALAFALSAKKSTDLYETALRRLSESQTLDALVAKASIANPKLSPVADKLIPAVCKVAVQKALALSLRVLAMKALAACLERPAACPTPVLIGQVLPALAKLQVDAEPALAMCLLGCYDLCAQRAPEAIARHVLPVLVGLLDEKTLNRKQFDMLVARVQSLLTRVIELRRTKDFGDPATESQEDTSFAKGTTQSDYFASDGIMPTLPTSTTTPESSSWTPPAAPPAAAKSDPLGLNRSTSSPKPISLGQPKRTTSSVNSRTGSGPPRLKKPLASGTGPPKLKVPPPAARQSQPQQALDPFAAPPLSASSSDPFASFNNAAPPSNPMQSNNFPASTPSADPFASSGFNFMDQTPPAAKPPSASNTQHNDPSDPFAGIDDFGSAPPSSSPMMMMPPASSNTSTSNNNNNNISSAFDFMS